MEYIELSLINAPGKYTLVDGDYDGEYFGQFRWSLLPNGYVARPPLRGDGEKNWVYLHHEVCRVPTGMWRDHINRDRLDNRSSNLRPVTQKESASNRNQARQSILTSSQPFRGIRPHYRRWVATCNGYLGTYPSAIEAAKAYDKAAAAKWGKDAILNFP